MLIVFLKVFLKFNTTKSKSIILINNKLYLQYDEIYVTDGFAYNCVDKEVLKKEIEKQFPNAKIKLVELDNINEFVKKDVIEGIKICCGSFYLCEKVL